MTDCILYSASNANEGQVIDHNGKAILDPSCCLLDCEAQKWCNLCKYMSNEKASEETEMLVYVFVMLAFIFVLFLGMNW